MTRRFSQITIAGLVGLVAALSLVGIAQAATEKVLYSFSGGADGKLPEAGLIFDTGGNLYGTTFEGGSAGFGSVFKLSPNPGGTWSESVIYSFQLGSGGTGPIGSLVIDHAGNLYGTASGGGDGGEGTVFEVSPNGDGTWTETTIHTFFCCSDGSGSYANLIFDAAGNLYGTTRNGGSFDGGVVFELTPAAGGNWSEGVIYNFPLNASGGGYGSQGGLVIDSTGNLYGTTQFAGPADDGAAFELSPSNGSWTVNVLHNFTGPDGANSRAGMIVGKSGALYGTTFTGGAEKCACGTVFRLKRSGGGGWKEQVVHSFAGAPASGPTAPLISDSEDNLYGTTYDSDKQVDGTVFELNPTTGVYSVLHTFGGADGSGPLGGLVLDSAGNLYGTTSLGGASGWGVVFETTP